MAFYNLHMPTPTNLARHERPTTDHTSGDSIYVRDWVMMLNTAITLAAELVHVPMFGTASDLQISLYEFFRTRHSAYWQPR